MAPNKFTASQASVTVQESGFNPALAFAFLGNKGELLFANKRMRILLQIPEAEATTGADLILKWPFFDELRAAPALLKDLLAVKSLKHARIWDAEARLKTYRLSVVDTARGRLVVAELRRSGDLLQDPKSRQVLFRTLSHEIRTAVQTLKGYADMLGEEFKEAAPIRKGILNSIARLDGVVERLEDLKSELKVLDHAED